MKYRRFAFLCIAALLVLTLAPNIEAVTANEYEDLAFAAADPSTVVYITKTGEKYHRGSCRYLSKSKTRTTLGEAKRRGYTPCKVCKPPS